MALSLGTENKRKTYLAIGLVALLVVVAGYEFYNLFLSGPPTAPAAAAPVPVATRPAATGGTAAATGAGHQAERLPTAAALDPTLHPEVMRQAENTVYNGNGRNIFSPDSAPPPIEKPQPFRPTAQASGPPPPAPPPPIDLKFYGYSTAPGERKQIFLLHGDDIFLAHEGDVVDRRYRIVSIQPFSVQVEDIPYHDTQSIPLTQN
jgi:hypothetical protein